MFRRSRAHALLNRMGSSASEVMSFSETDELQGISFRLGEYKFKGSEIDRKFSMKIQKLGGFVDYLLIWTKAIN